MGSEYKGFLESCDEFKGYANIKEYIDDIRRWLVLSGMCPNEESANRVVNIPTRASWIKEAFEKHEPVSDIAVDVGFFGG